MALLVINGTDLSQKLQDFSLTCKQCGCKDVTLDIDWAAYPSCSWLDITLSCGTCHSDEKIHGD